MQQATSAEVAQWVGRSGTSSVIVDQVLARAAAAHNLTPSALRSLALGPERRGIHDDICATVVHLAPLLAHQGEAAAVAAASADAAKNS